MDAIAEKPIAAIKEAPAFVKGIYYDSPDGRAAVESINSQIQTNLDKAESLKKQLADLDVLHNKVDSQLQQASKLHSEWLEVEKQMYKSLQPFSIPAVENKLRLAAQEAGSLSSTLAETFLEGSNETGDANDIGAFIRNYRAERKLFYLRSERLGRFKENRVS